MLLIKVWKNNRKISVMNKQAAAKSNSKVDRMNKIVILITILFVIFTLPVSFSQYFFLSLLTSVWGQFLIFLLDSLSFTYHAMNFFIIYISNNIFKREIKAIFNKNILRKIEKNNKNGQSVATSMIRMKGNERFWMSHYLMNEKNFYWNFILFFSAFLY